MEKKTHTEILQEIAEENGFNHIVDLCLDTVDQFDLYFEIAMTRYASQECAERDEKLSKISIDFNSLFHENEDNKNTIAERDRRIAELEAEVLAFPEMLKSIENASNYRLSELQNALIESAKRLIDYNSTIQERIVQVERISELEGKLKAIDQHKQILLTALEKITEMNYQHAEDQYGDRSKADNWACVNVAKDAMKSLTEQLK